MLSSFPPFIARALIGLWLNTSADSWTRQFVANDSPHVHARGTNPDRVLLTGDGAATGRGVVTHDLGLPGFLARGLSAHTGRAADVDIVVTSTMTAKTCSVALARVDLARFDIIVLSLGANEALALTPSQKWRSALTQLLSELGARAPTAEIFVLPVPFFTINPRFPTALARVVDNHVQELNTVTDEVAAERERVSVVRIEQDKVFEPAGAHIYQRWAEAIAARISALLDPSRSRAANTAVNDETNRQHALDDLGIFHSGTDPVLDLLTARARQAFGASIAAVTLVHSDTQLMKSATGIEPTPLPREQAFCDITIRRATHFVIEDTQLDSRFADYTVVTEDPKIRFYAGYPIESPDGHRVGALCIMDPEPRHFTPSDAELLRSLAQRVQTHIWRHSAQ